MITASDLSEFARLSALRPDELEDLARIARVVSFPAEYRLITEGDVADRCWLIRDGRILLDAHVPGRGDLVVQTLGSGDLLGWSWLVPPYRWSFGARTAEPVTAIEFDAAALSALAEADAEFGRTLTLLLFEVVLDRLQSTRARLLDLYSNPNQASAR
ncbi:cyclic nucleotide-binding domain-containing protein [Nocardia pseudobrasiliensis]|uniref:Cyclic nucleotide-binding protein n=1 Tax=Nocardia pseudobrasiliensis TaxID=45979 RepID=A0A370IC72_9NOCA|nr:cyclic nucleotide-binding domain-containing protein [Nocardia pseudobrasiliensis]RDI68325.1 cyclic nucleotide-binding protein [Nocardia pseudobrasiliensis]